MRFHCRWTTFIVRCKKWRNIFVLLPRWATAANPLVLTVVSRSAFAFDDILLKEKQKNTFTYSPNDNSYRQRKRGTKKKRWNHEKWRSMLSTQIDSTFTFWALTVRVHCKANSDENDEIATKPNLFRSRLTVCSQF